MAIVTLTSASGSPWVTTTAVGLGLTWPRPVVLVEADPSGGSAVLAGYFRGVRDDDGLTELVVDARQGRLAERLPELLFPIESTQVRVLPGPKAHEQAVGVALIWDDLLTALRGLDGGPDVIVDAGRLGLDGSPTPLLDGADVTVLLTRRTLPAIAAAQSWARSLRSGESQVHRVGLVLAGEGGYRPAEIQRALGLGVLAVLPEAPGQARVFAEGAAFPAAPWWRRLTQGPNADSRHFAASDLVTAMVRLGERLRQAAGDDHRSDVPESDLPAGALP